MTNAARRLHDQFLEWLSAGSSQSSATARGMTDTEGAAEQHREVMTDLLDVERGLRRLSTVGRPVDIFENMLPSWTMTVLSFPDWNNVPQSLFFTAHSMDVLRLLADTFDLLAPNVDLQPLEEIVAAAEQLLREDDTITGELRGYLHGLLQELRIVLSDVSNLSTFDLNGALQRLWVTFFAAAEQSSKPQGWRDLAHDVFVGTAGGLLANLPALGMQISQLPGIGS